MQHYLTIYLIGDINHERGQLNHGARGKGLNYQMNKKDGLIPVWFDQHQREYYPYPVWLKSSQINYVLPD